MPGLELLEKTIRNFPYVMKLDPLRIEGTYITGEVDIRLPDTDDVLSFSVLISPQFPLKIQDSESIRFINKELRSYRHVMHDGSICIHTNHCVDYIEKLRYDFNSLYAWIDKYYIHHDVDVHYEHIIVSPGIIDNYRYSYIFSDIEYEFKPGDYGTVQLSFLGSGIYSGKKISNFSVYSFTPDHKNKLECQWSKTYKTAFPSGHTGVFIFSDSPPIYDGKFIVERWSDLGNYFTQDFIDYLFKFIQKKDASNNKTLLPVFLGYKTIEPDIHWQVALLNIVDIPIEEEYIENTAKILVKQNKFGSKKIVWAVTENASYKYFFGRGSFCKNLTNSKILLVGVGAIGSIVGKSLVKGGCRYISIDDYDIKKTENICRSEYSFAAGIADKVVEFHQLLISNSPHVEVEICVPGYIDNIVKAFIDNENAKESFQAQFNQFDTILDCTTDNDLMYVFDNLNLDCQVINLSISNHANELVCAFSPNIYDPVNNVFSNIITPSEDLYEPTGCWSPTFKASYTDINLLVQMALRYINNIFGEKTEKQNFLVRPDKNNEGLKVIKF